MEIEQPKVIDLLDVKPPALSATSDMPVVETAPDASPPKEDKQPEPAAAPAEGAKTEPSESATEATDEQPGATEAEKKSTPRGVQKRLDELTRQREQAERLAEAERQEKLRLLALLEDRGKQPAAPEAEPEGQEPVRPARADFTDDASYIEAMAVYADQKAEYAAEQAVKRARAEDEQRRRQQQFEEARRTAVEAYQARITKLKETHPDFEEVAFSDSVQVSRAVAAAIEHSDDGPALQYYLGKNPAEAERLLKLPAPAQLVELGKIAAKLTAPEKAPEKPAVPPAPKVSAAPRPPQPLKGSDAPVQKDPSEMSMEEYAAYRKAQIAADRQGRTVRH